MVQCTDVHIHCGSTSPRWGSRCHQSKVQHTALSSSACEDTPLAWLRGQENQYMSMYIRRGLEVTFWQPVQSLRWFNQRCNNCPLKERSNTVARTESRRDTNGSTVKDAAFVVFRTVFITDTALVWWDNIEETWAVAWFWENRWEKRGSEAEKEKDTLMKVNETDKHALFPPPEVH